MNRSRLLFLLISGLLVLTILSGTLLGAPTRDGEGEDSLYKYLSVFTEVLRLVRQAYVDETDLDLLMNGALDGTPDALDPFSMYVPEDAVTDYMAARQVGETRSGLRVAKERGVAYVVAVQEKGPGRHARSAAGRHRLAPRRRLDARAAAVAHREGAHRRAPAPRSSSRCCAPARRRTSPWSSPSSSRRSPTSRPTRTCRACASPPSPRTRRRWCGKLMGSVQGDELLIDLRGVAFGDVERAYEVAKLFAGGDLGFLVKRDEKLETYTGAGAQSWRGKAVVLVDRGTQGAAEVLAQILRQRSGAKLVGQPTFGFAGRSKVIELDAGGSVVLTDAFFTGPDGKPVDEGHRARRPGRRSRRAASRSSASRSRTSSSSAPSTCSTTSPAPPKRKQRREPIMVRSRRARSRRAALEAARRRWARWLALRRRWRRRSLPSGWRWSRSLWSVSGSCSDGGARTAAPSEPTCGRAAAAPLGEASTRAAGAAPLEPDLRGEVVLAGARDSRVTDALDLPTLPVEPGAAARAGRRRGETRRRSPSSSTTSAAASR